MDVGFYGALATAILIVLSIACSSRSRLASAIDNMTQGLLLLTPTNGCSFAISVTSNCMASPKIVKPGCTLRDVLVHRQERGSLIGDIDKYCERVAKELLEGGKPFILSLADGRFIQIIDRPMASGGWVSTHEDITERRLFDKQIERLAHYDTLTGLPNRGSSYSASRASLNPATISELHFCSSMSMISRQSTICSGMKQEMNYFAPLHCASEYVPTARGISWLGLEAMNL